MKKNLFIIFTIFLSLSAQVDKETNNQRDNKSLLFDDKGVTKQQVESIIKENELDNQRIDDNSLNPKYDIIELDGVKYLKDGLKYIPIYEDKIYEEKNPSKKLSNKNIQSLSDEIELSPRINLKYYGYQVFDGDPTTFQSSTFGAVDPDYNIGPEDQIILMLWGESQFRQEFTIDPEGYVFLPEVGQVFVNGLTLQDLEKKFFLILSKVYSTLKPPTGQPTTFMDISLGNLRPLRIIVLGEVEQPGAYSVSPSTSLSSSLYYFHGPTTNGSLRDIRLIRNGKLVGNIDFYNYLLSGNAPDDLRLQLDDVVFIPPRGKTVSVRGAISREGIYEIKETEGLRELLQIAGNISVNAYMKRIQISRIIPNDDRSILGMDRMLVDIDLNDLLNDNKNYKIYDGDDIEIFSIDGSERNYVDIMGSSINRPGRYQLNEGMRVKDLIDTADGLLNNAYLNVAHIFRTNETLNSKIIPINLNKVIAEDKTDNITLQYMDKLIIYNNNILQNSFSTINITGPLKKEGRYNLDKDKTLGDIIIESGGFIPGIKNVRISVARINEKSFNPIIFFFPDKNSSNPFIKIDEINESKNKLSTFLLKPNDVINIYSDPLGKSPKMISVFGAVYYPGSYPISKNGERISDIISRAGGILPEGYPMASSFTRENKEIRLSFEKILKNYSSKENFEIMDGDRIFISTKPNYVEVVGEVNNPGFFQYFESSSLKDYLDIAGGLTVDSERREIWVTYPDGSSKQQNRFFLSPKIYDGSVITVGKEVATDPINKTDLAKEIASIVADFLQIYISLTILWSTSQSS